jgi:hypothetical protein
MEQSMEAIEQKWNHLMQAIQLGDMDWIWHVACLLGSELDELKNLLGDEAV